MITSAYGRLVIPAILGTASALGFGKCNENIIMAGPEAFRLISFGVQMPGTLRGAQLHGVDGRDLIPVIQVMHLRTVTYHEFRAVLNALSSSSMNSSRPVDSKVIIFEIFAHYNASAISETLVCLSLYSCLHHFQQRHRHTSSHLLEN